MREGRPMYGLAYDCGNDLWRVAGVKRVDFFFIRDFQSLGRKIIRYSGSTLNVYFLLSQK